MVALNVGQDFKQRWLATPTAVRQLYLDDLARICELLQRETQSKLWLEHEQIATQETAERLKQAYAEHKAALIAAEKQRRQQYLEARLAEKRRLEAEKIQALEQAEQQQQAQQQQLLRLLRQQQQHALQTYVARYHKNPDQQYIHFNKALKLADHTLLSELETLRLRLELEADAVIESQVNSLRQQLKIAAQEEIELLLKTHPVAERV